MSGTFADGLALMVIGMGTVLLFLCLMIVAMAVMSKIVVWLGKFFPEAVPVTAGGGKNNKTSNDEEVAVAILAAMKRK